MSFSESAFSTSFGVGFDRVSSPTIQAPRSRTFVVKREARVFTPPIDKREFVAK